MVPESAISYLKDIKARNGRSECEPSIKQLLVEAKKQAIAAHDQQTAKTVWIHEQILKVQELYLTAFSQLKEKEFYKAWCTLEQCELTINNLHPHLELENGKDFLLPFIQEHVDKYQSIFPYKIFMSPEILEKEKKCNICGQKVSIRNP